MGDHGSGLLDAGHGPACRRQMAHVEDHYLRGGGECRVAAGVSPSLEPPPGGSVGPAGVLILGVPESGGYGLGHLAVATRQFQGLAQLSGGARSMIIWPQLNSR